jgi:N-acetylmuramoyl-L-alanine amidase
MFVVAALVLAGCANAPVYKAEQKPLPPDWDSELGPMHEIENPAVVTFSPQTNSVPATVTNSSVPPRPRPTSAVAETGMVPLSRWATQNGFGAVRVLPLTPTVAHVVKTPFGNFTVRANSLTAYWGRVEVRLGFRPQQIGDQIFLHALDIKKILQPLSHGTAVVTPASRLVVIDPGHGGANSGTRNVVTGRYEKDYTLDWARRLGPLLEQSGWRVALTRTNDVTLSLADRVAFAENLRANLFISLHFNATGDGSSGPSGLETYCLTPTGMPSSITRGYADDARQIFPNNRFDADNLRYAVRLHTSLLQVNGNNDRGVRHARFLDVLTGHNRPAVLIEGGFLSNPTEARQVADPVYRQKLAEAVAKALE